MNIYLINGDMDYIVARHTNEEQRSAILSLQHSEEVESSFYSVEMRFDFHEPFEQGVFTDFPDPDVGGTLILSRLAIDALANVLTDSGTLLPIEPAHPLGYQLFLCHRNLDALDQDRSDFTRHPGGRINNVRRYELNRDVLDNVGIFRMDHRPGALYVSDRFMDVVERNGLLGLQIKKIWSEAEGGVEIQDPVDPFGRGPMRFVKPESDRRKREKRDVMRKLVAARPEQWCW